MFARRSWLPLAAGALLALAILALLVYQIPWVKVRVDWRLDVARTYLRGVVQPVQPLPAPQMSVAQATPLPSATPHPPTATPQASPTPLPGAAKLPAPGYELQGPNNCGPATLAMYLRYYGWSGDQYTISDEIKPVNADRNVNVDELIHYARNYAGWLNSLFRVGGDVQLLKEFVSNGIPVMVEKGNIIPVDYFMNDDHWNGHYALVTGYDDATGMFLYQDSFDGADRQMRYAEFDEFWKQFNRVYILVYRPDQEEQVRQILGEDWDVDTNRSNAQRAAEAEVQADAEDAYAWFNLGMNQVHFLDYGAAALSFDRAREIGLPQRMLRYQFGPFFAYYNTGRMDDMQTLVSYALRITENSEEALIWNGWILYRQGDVNGAVQQFRLAQEANPKSVYADQALSSIGVQP